MTPKTLFRTCATGTVVSAICCATPVLVITLGALGMGAAVGWLDYVLIPAFLGFAAATALAYAKLRRARDKQRGEGTP